MSSYLLTTCFLTSIISNDFGFILLSIDYTQDKYIYSKLAIADLQCI